MKNFYITTAIDYANGAPHIGHAYEKVLSDVIARTKRLEAEHVHFLTGLDEHGQKVQQTAEKLGVEPQENCDTIAEAFKQMCSELEISYDQYIRTTDEAHKEVVRGILQKLYDEGQIYKADYAGFYSAKEEQFLQEKDRNEDGSWPSEYGEVVEITESNYFFKLAQHQDWLRGYIEENEDFIFPKYRAKQILEFLKEPLNDLCISRPKERLAWGIALPFDEEYVTYVWFDALINYISAIGYPGNGFGTNWPADLHVIGKDILVPAHGIYWPIMLKAIGIELPKKLLVHGWWSLGGDKMSKSTGNTLDPLKIADQFGTDSLRYFLMREMSVGGDADFSLDQFLARYNVLANDLGNLVSRLLNMTARYTGNQVPVVSIEQEAEKELKELWEETKVKVPEAFNGLQFHIGLEDLFAFIRGINKYAETRAPWKLAKSEEPEDRQKLETSLAYMAESLRLAATLLWPVMPDICTKIHRLLSLDAPSAWGEALEWNEALFGNPLGDKCILFPKIEREDIVE